jgi:hypothetical protein
MIKPIQKDDITVRKLTTYKNWNLPSSSFDRYYGSEFGNQVSGSTFDEDIESRVNGVYPRLLYSSIKQQYYYNPTTGSAYLPGYRENYTSTDERVLEDEIVVLSISSSYYGEGIKPNSVILTDNSSSMVLRDDGYSNLKSGSVIYGNIFYGSGLLVMTKNINSESYQDVSIKFKSTQTIYEHELFLTVGEYEANTSTNPSAVSNIEGRPFVKKWYPSITDSSKSGSWDDYFTKGLTDETGSYLRPYITTIGFYDDEFDLIFVAKLAKPVKKLPDYPLNFIVRFDM